MSDAWNSIKIREFEHVLAAPSVALLRISGRPSRRRSDIGPRPVLLADDGQTVQRFAAIPSPPDKRGLLRTAYSVGLDLIAPGTIFSLELTDGNVIALPAPSPGAARLIREPDAPPPAEPAEPAEPPPGTDERRSGLVSKLTELSARLAESEQARGGLETAASEARQETEQAKEQLASQHADLANLEEQLASQRADLANLKERLAEADRRADELQRACQQLEQSREEQRAHVGRLEQAVAEAVAARDELDQSIAPLRAARERAEHELAEAQDAVRKMTTERDELSRQATAFDAVAIKARERAAEAEAEAEKASASVHELEIWSGELERRLTDATDELSAVKAAHARDQAEVRRLGGEFAEAEAKVELLEAELKTFKLSPSERERIARQAAELAALLGNADRFTELVRQLSDARAQVESLQASLSAVPGPAVAADDEARTGAHEEIEQLHAQLAQAPTAGDDAQVEAIRHAAEAEARELAERELGQATRVNK